MGIRSNMPQQEAGDGIAQKGEEETRRKIGSILWEAQCEDLIGASHARRHLSDFKSITGMLFLNIYEVLCLC